MSSHPQKILVCSTSWVGDCVMSMPAVQAYKESNPDAKITVLAKSAVLPLWELHPSVDGVVELELDRGGLMRTAKKLRAMSFSKAFILPNSPRSALIPFLARIPERIGAQGKWRKWLVTRVVRPRAVGGRVHQSYEYLDIMLPDALAPVGELPRLSLPGAAMDRANRVLPVKRPIVALIPGAARGPAKQWPEPHFIKLGGWLAGAHELELVILGTSGEVELCQRIANQIGARAHNLAGQLAIDEWVAVLKQCDLVVANDSGGMHVAAAVGAKVVALYGSTDPAKTGPLGDSCRILKKGTTSSRDVERASEEAMANLAAITPEEVYDAVIDLMFGGKKSE